MSLLVSTSSPPGTAAAPAPWTPDRGDGTYQNPVLFADYSDPDVVRVGDDFWLVSSSFSHVPGLPILYSRDLVNWELVNHALPTLSYVAGEPDHFAVPRHGAGVWAPSIRFHAGKFWIFFPDPDYGIFVVTATDPRGAWSAPICVKPGKGLIDPCPLWDDDGKVYLIHGWAKSRSGKNNQVTLNELSADATRVIDGEGVVILNENNSVRGWSTLEGPKFYRHAGEYFIFAPVNGVPTGDQAVYRAKNIRGPYAARLVLGQGATPINGPHQGGWVDTPAGENWFLHFQDRGPFGRVVHLEPMSWASDGWPRMGTGVATGAEKGEPVLTHAKPISKTKTISAPATSDEFDSPVLGLQWQWQANPLPEWFSLSAKPGSLRLGAARVDNFSLYAAPNLLLQKFPAPAFTATTALDATNLKKNSEAGLVVFGYNYASIGLWRDNRGTQLIQVVHIGADKTREATSSTKLAITQNKIFLRVSVTPDAKCRFAYSLDGETFRAFGEEVQATVGRWVGAKVGLFADITFSNEAPLDENYADFDFFRVTP